MRRFPFVAALVVIVAVAVMIALGVWQLLRMQEKEGLLQRYANAARVTEAVPFPQNAEQRQRALYRRSSLDCLRVDSRAAISGRNAQGEAGWSMTASCVRGDGTFATVVLGWARRAAEPQWNGGMVTGVIGPAASGEVRLVADPPLAGLSANAMPDPRDVPNNHFSYAMQWFFFALAATVIFMIAVAKRLAAGGSPR